MHKLHVCSRRLGWIALGLAWISCSIALGADANAPKVNKVLTGLKNPHGVAIRPEGSSETYEVFVVESGAGRVFKIVSNKPEKKIDVVSGFAANSANGDRPKSNGVHSIFFLDHMRLAIAGGDDGKPFLRLYELPEPESPLSADLHKDEAKLPESGTEPGFTTRAFNSIARTRSNDRVGDFLLAAGSVDGKSPELAYIPFRSGALGDVVPAQLKNAEEGFQISAITVGDNGYVVVAGTSVGDSQQPGKLAFFSPLDRRIVMQLSTNLRRIVALAYSPKSGNLYAANSPSPDDGHGGIYRIDRASEPNSLVATAVKVADVAAPTALTFSPDGTLYVTSAGDAKDKSSGTLLKLTGNL